MKFGEIIEVDATPEWRDFYIQYNQLKLLVDAVPPNSGAPLERRRSSNQSGSMLVSTANDDHSR